MAEVASGGYLLYLHFSGTDIIVSNNRRKKNFFFEMGSLSLRLVLNLGSSFLHLLSAGITGVSHQRLGLLAPS
jgi:hypothetical protein